MTIKRLIFCCLILGCLSSCNPGTGCLINESAHVKMGKDGKLPTGGGSSNLFDKKMRKKLGRH